MIIKKFIPFLIILLLLIIIRNSLVSISSSFKNENTKEKLEEKLAEEEKKNQFLNERLFYVETQQFVEEEARKLGMLKSGEFLVIAPTAAPLNQKRIEIDTKPNWRKWLELFF